MSQCIIIIINENNKKAQFNFLKIYLYYVFWEKKWGMSKTTFLCLTLRVSWNSLSILKWNIFDICFYKLKLWVSVVLQYTPLSHASVSVHISLFHMEFCSLVLFLSITFQLNISWWSRLTYVFGQLKKK
jgi:hypothetical protein